MIRISAFSNRASAAALAAASLAILSPASGDTPKPLHRFDRGRDAPRGYPGSALVECGSGEYKSKNCEMNVGFRVVDARVHKRRSRADCDKGKDWGLNGRYLWVKDGCRAVFEVSSAYFDPPRRTYGDREYGGPHDPWREYDDRTSYADARYTETADAVAACARHGVQLAWNRGRYSAQYVGHPEIELGRAGRALVMGRMRTYGSDGYRVVSTRCSVVRGVVTDFDIAR